MNEFQIETLKSYLKTYGNFSFLLQNLINDYNNGNQEDFMDKLNILKTNHSLQESFLKRMGIITNSKEDDLRKEIEDLKLIINDKSGDLDLNIVSIYMKNKQEILNNFFNEIGIYCYVKLNLNSYGTLNITVSLLGDYRTKSEYFKTEEKYKEELIKKEEMKKNLYNNFNIIEDGVMLYLEASEENINRIKNYINDLTTEKEYYQNISFKLSTSDDNKYILKDIDFTIESIESNILINKFKNFR